MSKNVLVNLDMNGNSILNLLLNPLAIAPEHAPPYYIYTSTATATKGVIFVNVGTYETPSWQAAGSIGPTVTSVNGETGDVVLDQDDVGDGSTYVRTHNDFTDALKTALEAVPTTYAPLASPALTGTPTAPTAASGTNTTQIATTAFVMAAVAALGEVMVFKGVVDATHPLPDTHKVGWTYKVGTAGTYAGVVCEVGDTIICVADGSSASNADWYVLQANIDGAVTGPSSATDGHLAAFDGTTGKIIKDGYGVATSISNDSTSVPTTAAVNTAVTGLIKTASGTIGTSATSASVSYTGTIINAYVVDGSGNEVITDITIGSSAVTFTVAAAPSAALTCKVVYV